MRPPDIDRDFLGAQAADALILGSLAAFRSNAPGCPPETCPMVDRLSAQLDAISGDFQRIREEMELCGQRSTRADLLGRIMEWEEEVLDADSGMAGARLKLEDIRTANDQLRRSSYYWRRACDRLAERVREFKCDACGGSGEYLNKRRIRDFSPPGETTITLLEEAVDCKRCEGSGLHPLARAILGGAL